MCGIVAIIAPQSIGFNQSEMKAFTDMLFVDTLRGFDSTGVFGVSSDNDVSILKAAKMGPEFIAEPSYKTFMSDHYMNGRIIVGHNRAATRGTISDKNAHPFWVEDNVILVQNGTWNGDHSHVKNTDVDTEVIAHLMHDNQDDIEKGLQKVNAAYALIWYNRTKKTLYAIRNDQRPLHIGYCKNGTILLASELSTIFFAAHRQGLEIESSPYEMAEDTLNSWTFTDNGELEFSGNKIDNTYRGSLHQPQRHNFYPGFGGGGEDYDYSNHPLDRSNKTPQLAYSTKPDDIRIAISDYITEGRFPDFEMSYLSAKTVRDCAEALDKDKAIGVKFMDYLPGNKHVKCTCWYLIGKLLVPETDIVHNVFVYYPLLNKTEEEVIEYISTNMFTAKIGIIVQRFIPKAEKHIISMSVNEVKEFENLNATT